MSVSLRKAINAKCKDCIYDPLNGGTWLKQVELCTCEDSCPLWPVRPLPKTSRQNAVKKGDDGLIRGIDGRFV